MTVSEYMLYWLFQSTHPQGVRHMSVSVDFDQNGVSIHAPAGGATLFGPSGEVEF